jgi:hypothetical protein
MEYDDLYGLASQYPILARFISDLRVAGGPPVTLRIGGWSSNEISRAGVFAHAPTAHTVDWSSWFGAVGHLVRDAQLRLILGLNLPLRSPAVAAQLARRTLHAFPARSIVAFELGNEPDLFSKRQSFLFGFTPSEYVAEARRYAARLAIVAPRIPLAGPATAEPRGNWLRTVVAHARVSRISELTVHRYPFIDCPQARPQPTVLRYLSSAASDGFANALIGAAVIARHAHIPLRVSELGDSACAGVEGVTDTFATALWSADALFSMLARGVASVNVHVRVGTFNSPLSPPGRVLTALPMMYGMILFDRTIGRGGRVVEASISARAAVALKAWVVRTERVTRMLLINKGGRPVRAWVALKARRLATVERLLAPSPFARTGVTLAGQTLGDAGMWQGARVTSITRPRGGRYTISIPAYSAALLSTTD